MGTVIDLTDDTLDDDSLINNEKDSRDTEITPDVIDLLDSDDEVDTRHAIPMKGQAAGIAKNTHPRKVHKISRKRRWDRAKEVAASRAAVLKKKSPSPFDPANIPGGCNFIVIDDDPSDDEAITDEKKSAKIMSSHDTHRPHSNEEQNKKRAFDLSKNYNYLYSQETALQMQERLLREAATKLKTQQAAARIVLFDSVGVPSIDNPMLDIHVRFPDHWKWKEPYACLGLPQNAPSHLVKSQFRRLARIYHPDKSKLAETSKKFHGVVTAYRKLT